MFAPAELLPNAISELFAQASYSGVITLADRYALMAAVSNDSLDEEERRAIDRLLRAICRGRIRPSNELSTVC
ncbi:MAG: hypothetical protein KME16_22245 [Scytolyngbya sp. HA4215-MV1]|jgi:hypothetical protein|nr:hypothetical protein [Scytolyngbya sp. HA4215-MV1]